MADRTMATAHRRHMAVATARADAANARCSARRARVAAKRLRSRSSQALTNPSIARIASSSAVVIAVAGMAAARADGAGTECRVDNSVVPRRGRVPNRRRAKTRDCLMQTRVVCSPQTAATLDGWRRLCATCSNSVTKRIGSPLPSRRRTPCASTVGQTANWPKHSAHSRWRAPS